MTVAPKFTMVDKVGDTDDGYRVAAEAHAIAAKFAPYLPDPLMGELWDLCRREYRRATEPAR